MKRHTFLFLIIAISAIPFISMFTSPLAPHTHDSPVHFARMAAYYKALGHGQIFPRWAGELNYGYGMPLFNFMYHVPYLVTSLFIRLGAGLVLSFKLALFVSFALSGMGMYLFAHALTRDRRIAFISALSYLFSPFHLVDLVVRGDLAEGFALSFFPFVLYGILKLQQKTSIQNFVTLVGSSTLLILSHNSMSLVFFGIAALFSLWYTPVRNRVMPVVLAMTTSVLLAAFYWIPALFERKYTYGDLFMKDMYKSHFAPLFHFFLPNFTNAESLQTGGIAVTLGLIPVVILIVCIAGAVKKSTKNRPFYSLILFCLTLFSVALFFMQPVSMWFWEHIAILRMFQFPWRLLNVTTFSLALLTGLILVPVKLNRTIFLLLCACIVLPSAVYFSPPLGMDKIHEQEFWDYPLNTTYFGETDVIWSAGPAGSYPEKRFQVIGGDATITDAIKGDTIHTFTVQATTESHIVDKTQYFPGWRVYVDGKKVPVEFQDQNWRGLITFTLPAGNHTVRVAFENSPVRALANWISIISLGTFLLYALRTRSTHT